VVDPARIAAVLDPAYLADLPSLSMEELRSRRAACQAIEVALSYQRRMAQGRLDIVGAERAQRAGGGSAPHVGEGTEELVEHLSGVLADRGRSPGFGHMPQLMAPEAADVDTSELDAIARPTVLAALDQADDDELDRLVAALTAYERGMSDDRRALHGTIDTLQAEIARRYRTGEASVDSLLR
jgi:hypothetical protein